MRLLLGSILLGLGCGRMAIDGEVVDASGKPVVGARVSVYNSPCNALVGEDGKYALPCTPGEYRLLISAAGYTTEEIDIDASERKRYSADKTVLIKIPDERGLFMFSESAYVTMTEAQASRNMVKDGKLYHRSVCLDTDANEPNVVSAGNHAFFDYEHPGWRPWRLDEEGCAYRDTKDERAKWTVTYREKAEFQKRQINEGKTVVLMSLKPGDYFIAEWKGFFVPVDRKENKHKYKGFWIKVE